MCHHTGLVCIALLCTTVGAALPDGTLRAQPTSGSDRPLVFSAFLGAASTNLAGGPSKGGQFHGGPWGVAVERRVGRALSFRAEAFGQTAGADLGQVEQDFFEYEGRIDRGQAGVGGFVRANSSLDPARGLAAGVGAAVTGQTSCYVDLEGGPGFFGGKTVTCAEWTTMELRPSTITTSVIGAVGMVRRQFAVELRYDHGLQPAIRTRSGDMHVRSLSAVVHVRIRAGS